MRQERAGRSPLATRSGLMCVVAAVVAFGCSSGVRAPAPAFPKPPASRAAVGGTATAVAGSATFDAPFVDLAAWQGTPMGTGSFSVSLTPTATGGPGAVAGLDASGGSPWYAVGIADFFAQSLGLVIVTDTAWAVGTRAIDQLHTHALVYELGSGRVVAEATAGSITFGAAGTALGQRVAGSLSGTFAASAGWCTVDADCAAGEVCQAGACAVPPPPACTTNAQCARGEICQAGVCLPAPAGCTSSAQCAAGQVCQAGVCVTAPTGCTSSAQCGAGQVCQGGQCVTTPAGCTSNAQCAAGEVCQGGRCVAAPAGCTSNAQCAAGQVCQAGVCVTAPTGCTSNAQCAAGQVCQAGVCVTAPTGCTSSAQCARGEVCQNGVCVVATPVSCGQLQGGGSYSGSFGALSTCSAAGTSVALQGLAALDDSQGPLSLYIVDQNTGTEGLVVELNQCPSAPGTVQVGGSVTASLYSMPTGLPAGTELYVIRHATGGTVTFSQVGAVIAGTVSLTFGGGTVTGTFQVQ